MLSKTCSRCRARKDALLYIALLEDVDNHRSYDASATQVKGSDYCRAMSTLSSCYPAVFTERNLFDAYIFNTIRIRLKLVDIEN